MQGLMVQPKPPVLVLNDDAELDLAPPSENKRWNESNPTKKKKNELKYTAFELIALHVQTGDKAGVIKAIDKSGFLPNASALKLNKNSFFPKDTEQYDEDTVKKLLLPYTVGSKEWRAQADKIADAQSHEISLSKICNMYRGYWEFRPYHDEQVLPPPTSPPDISPALLPGVYMARGTDAHDKENTCTNECCRVHQDIPAKRAFKSAPASAPNRPSPILTSQSSQPSDKNSPRNVSDFPSEPTVVTPTNCVGTPDIEDIVLTESGHIRSEVVGTFLTSFDQRKSDMHELKLSKDEEKLRAALAQNKLKVSTDSNESISSNKHAKRVEAAKMLRPLCNIRNVDNTEEMKLQVTDKTVSSATTTGDVQDLNVVMYAISKADSGRAASALIRYIKKDPDLRMRVLDGLKSEENSDEVLQRVVDGMKKSIAHHTNPNGGTRPKAEETCVKNVVVSCLFNIVDEGYDIPNSTLCKLIGTSTTQVKFAREKAQELLDNSDGITAYKRKRRDDFIQEKVGPYIFAFLQDDEVEATRFDSNQSFVTVKDPTTGKDKKIHKRIWLIVNKREQHIKFLDSEYYASFQGDHGDATVGYHVWHNVLKRVGKFVTNPLPISCVDEKTSALEHMMRALLGVLRRSKVKEELEKLILNETGLTYDELVNTLQRAGSYQMVEAVLCPKIDYTYLHIDKTKPCPRGTKFECTHGNGYIPESGIGAVKCQCCGVKKKLGILDRLASLPEAEDSVRVMVWKDGIRQGTDKDGKQNTQREILPELMTVKDLIGRFTKQVDKCIPHVAEIRWCSMMMELDRARLQPGEMIINTDYAASMCLKGSETKNSSVDSHAVNDNFVCVYNPRTVNVKSKKKENGIEVETNEDVKIFTVDVHHFFAETISKGKKTDHAMHNDCLDKLIKYYQQKIPGLKKIIVWTDNAPGQYRCRQNFLKVASVEERHPGIQIVHRLAVSANFKGIHDAVGKDPAQLVSAQELENNRSENAWGVFLTCRQHLEKTEDQTKWKGYEATGDARLKNKKVYGMDTRRVWFVVEDEQEFQLRSREHPGRIVICDRSFILDTYKEKAIKGTTCLHEIRSIATDGPTQHPIMWPVNVYRLPCNCDHCYQDPHNTQCEITKWRRPRRVKMRVAEPSPDQRESIVGESVAYATESGQGTKPEGAFEISDGIYVGKVVQYDSSIQSWLVKYDDERLADDVFCYDELCSGLRRYRRYTKRTADEMMLGATDATNQASAALGGKGVPSSDPNPIKKPRHTMSPEEVKMEYSACLRSVLDALQCNHSGDTSKLNKKQCCVLLWCCFKQLHRHKSAKCNGKDGVKDKLSAAIKANPTWQQQCQLKNNENIISAAPVSAAITSNPSSSEPHFELKNNDNKSSATPDTANESATLQKEIPKSKYASLKSAMAVGASLEPADADISQFMGC